MTLHYRYYKEPDVKAPAVKITRIDLIEKPEGVLVRKFKEGWTSYSVADQAYMIEGATIDELVAKVDQSKWFVRQWPGGARLWLGDKPIPVRSRYAIQKMREQFSRYREYGTLDERIQLHTVNFALDF